MHNKHIWIILRCNQAVALLFVLPICAWSRARDKQIIDTENCTKVQPITSEQLMTNYIFCCEVRDDWYEKKKE